MHYCAVWVYTWLLNDQIWVETQLGIWQCVTVMAWQRSSFEQSFEFPQCGSSIWPLVWSIKYPLNIQNLVTCLPCEYYLTFYQLNLIKGTKITQTLNCGHLFFNWKGPLLTACPWCGKCGFSFLFMCMKGTVLHFI